MDRLLSDRAVGILGPDSFARLETARLLHNFRPAPQHRFDGGQKGTAIDNIASSLDRSALGKDQQTSVWAHQAGVNALALERFDGKILISGGSDASIRIWDLEQCGNPHDSHVYKPVAKINRSESNEKAHQFGITSLSFYPFDPNAFLSSSYDQTLKLWDTDSTLLSGSWDLDSKLYTHAISPVADHLLIACGTAHPAVRLVDLRSNAAVQSLVAPGQVGIGGGAVLSLAWSPRQEHVLVSGTLDGAVRIWDVRRASSLLGLLDQEDSLGLMEHGNDDGRGKNAMERGYRISAKAHSGPVNGLTWTDDGAYIISAGHDRRIRVWDAATGANTLASFGPSIKNGQLANIPMFVSPIGLTLPKKELLFWPNETEILVMELHEGTTITRLRSAASQVAGVKTSRGGSTSIRNRVTSIVWRGAGGHGGASGGVMGGVNSPGGIYSGQTDGVIRAWMPNIPVDDAEETDEKRSVELEEEDNKGQKRKAIHDAFNSLMGNQITFT